MEQGRLVAAYSGTSTEALPTRVDEGQTIAIDQGSHLSTAEPIQIDDLYPVVEARVGALPAALSFLREACDTTLSALQSYVDRDFLQADEQMQHVHASLYEAFCQRELGDGYGGVINACMAAFENARGQPFSA